SSTIWSGRGTTKHWSRHGRWMWQCRPTITSSISTESETVDQEFTRTPGDSTELETEAPETTTPGEITESTAEPTRPGPACTNFAGGALRWPVKDRKSVVEGKNVAKAGRWLRGGNSRDK